MGTTTTTSALKSCASTAIKRLPASLSAIVRNYRDARADKKRLDAEARKATDTVKKLQDTILEAMAGETTCAIGKAYVTVKTTSAAVATITMPDGEVIPWANVTSILVGNRTYKTTGAKLYGGRSASAAIEVAGEI
jgi:hypothetical protein